MFSTFVSVKRQKKKIPIAVDRSVGDPIFLNPNQTRNSLEGNDFFPFVENETERYYISGPSGSGKSTFAAGLIRIYKKVYPKNRVFIFSSLKADKVLDTVPALIRIDLNKINDQKSKGEEKQENKKKPAPENQNDNDEEEEDENAIYYSLEAQHFEHSLVLFDDVDTLQNDYIGTLVLKFRDFLLEQHRHFHIFLVATTHVLMNYQATKRLLNEAQKVVVFPRSGNVAQVNTFLSRYVGWSKKDIERFYERDPQSRWKLVHKNFPNYVLSQHLIE